MTKSRRNSYYLRSRKKEFKGIFLLKHKKVADCYKAVFCKEKDVGKDAKIVIKRKYKNKRKRIDDIKNHFKNLKRITYSKKGHFFCDDVQYIKRHFRKALKLENKKVCMKCKDCKSVKKYIGKYHKICNDCRD